MDAARTATGVIVKVARPHPETGKLGLQTYTAGCTCARASTAAWCNCWVLKKVTPDGIPLKYCVWHSGPETCAGMPLNLSPRHYTKEVPQYGYWTDKFECFDTCWVTDQEGLDRHREVCRHVNACARQAEAVANQIAVALAGHRTVGEQRDAQMASLAEVRAAIKKFAGPTARDHQRESFENIVAMATTNLESVLAQAAVAWETRSTEANRDDASRSRYIAGLSFVQDAQDRLKKAKEKLENWINKSSTAATILKLQELKSREQNLATEVTALSEMYRQGARAPFYELYTALTAYSQLPFPGGPFYSPHRETLEYLRSKQQEYRAELAKLSALIPVATHEEVYAGLMAEREAAAKAAAAIAAAAKKTVTQVNTTSTLGQLYLGGEGEVIEEALPTGPALIVTAKKTASTGAAGDSAERWYARYEAMEGEEDDSRYFRGSRYDRSTVSRLGGKGQMALRGNQGEFAMH